MPLVIIVCGPCSGKTFTANKLKEYLENTKGKQCVLINEESLSVIKAECYVDSNSEKMIRAKLKSEVEKNLDDKTVVIVDSLNYIKGFRYELFCLVRNFKTTSCVVHCRTDLEVCLKLNSMSNSYSEDLLKDLYSRMEEPNQNSNMITYNYR